MVGRSPGRKENPDSKGGRMKVRYSRSIRVSPGYRLLPVLSLIFALAPNAEAARAQDLSPANSVSSATSAGTQIPTKKWEFATIGYVWFAGAHGKTDVIGPAEPVDLDLSFGDVLKAFKFAFMGAAEARHDRLVILGDLTFIHLDASKGIKIREQDFLDAELDSRTAEITL